MDVKTEFNPHGSRVLDGDRIWDQVKMILSERSLQLPQTPRRPDMRLIINNTSGHDIQFQNPGNHSDGVPERIPAVGDKTAVMVMVKGETLDEQYKNAKTLYEGYDLGVKGLSDAFVTDLRQGKLADLVDEAYGPAPFQMQAGKLTDTNWTAQDGAQSQISPEVGADAAFGVRPPTKESVFLAELPALRIKGTGTTAEVAQGAGMDIAVGTDGTRETTRPIAPGVATAYYGVHVNDIPAVIITPTGKVMEVDLNDSKGTVIKNTPSHRRAPRKPADPRS